MAEFTVEQAIELGVQHHESSRYREAEGIYRQVLLKHPERADVHQLLGVLEYQLGHFARAVEEFELVIGLEPAFAAGHENLGSALKELGRVEEAIACYKRAIVLSPGTASAYKNLGLALHGRGLLSEAAGAYREALALDAGCAGAFHCLGNTLLAQDQISAAVEAFRKAAELEPDSADVSNDLGNGLKRGGLIEEAILEYERALSIRPGSAAILSNYAAALTDGRRFEEAIGACEKAIGQDPRFAEAYNNLGFCLSKTGRVEEAIVAFEGAVALRPTFTAALTNLGNAQSEMGLLDEALASYKRVMAINPQDARAHSNYVYSLSFHPDYDAKAILRAAKHWNECHGQGLRSGLVSGMRAGKTDRRIRVGYVSPDFYNHCSSFFTIPLLSTIDRSKFEIFCYSDVACEDGITQRIKGLADQWRRVVDRSDEQLCNVIREDGIDILVDLTMHMRNNRMMTFARRAAAVQMTWLAYPGTTGLAAMDYRLTDPYLDPPESDAGCYSEESVRLRDTFWCYDPLESEPSVNVLPAVGNGYITFGCFNNLSKVNGECLRLWARVLGELRGSRMVILCPTGEHRGRIIAGLGVDAGRVDFVERRPREEYLKFYHRVDLCLDTIPYNGHTTSMDAYWMGVPTITLCGNTCVGRAGFALATNLKLGEFVAYDAGRFVEIARGVSADVKRLAEIRGALRERMKNSPLMDAKGFAKNMEEIYREMWKRAAGR